MGITRVDYRSTLFETQSLPKHTGEPTSNIIRGLHNTLKTNANDVMVSLGGTNHRYLGLLLSDAAYALIPNQPFVHPAHSGILVIPVGSTNHMFTILREQHKEAPLLFIEYRNVEKAPQQQLTKAIDPVYLDALRDANTNAINLPI